MKYTETMNLLQGCLCVLHHLAAIERMLASKGPPGKAHTHQMDDLGNTIVREWVAKLQTTKEDWHERPLNWGKARIHELLVFQTAPQIPLARISLQMYNHGTRELF